MIAKPIVEFWLPIHTISELNVSQREHFTTKSKRHKAQRSTAHLCAMAPLSAAARSLTLPLSIVLERRGDGELDTDNLTASQKHVRDGLTDALQAVMGRALNARDTDAKSRAPKDDSDRLNWFVCQRRPASGGTYAGCGVHVRVYRRGAAAEVLERASGKEFFDWISKHVDVVDALLVAMGDRS